MSDDIRSQLERHHREAFAWSVACCRGDRGMAEDVLQTSYLKILDGRAVFRRRSSFRTWLFAVIRNTGRDAARSPWRRRRRPLAEADAGVRAVAPPDAAGEGESRALARALAALPRRQGQVLALVYGHGLLLREVAAVLGISQGSAARHLHRGKRRLRESLQRPRRGER